MSNVGDVDTENGLSFFDFDYDENEEEEEAYQTDQKTVSKEFVIESEDIAIKETEDDDSDIFTGGVVIAPREPEPVVIEESKPVSKVKGRVKPKRENDTAELSKSEEAADSIKKKVRLTEDTKVEEVKSEDTPPITWEDIKNEATSLENANDTCINNSIVKFEFSSDESDVELFMQLKAKKSLTSSEADVLGKLQAKFISSDREQFVATLKKSASILLNGNLPDYDAIYSEINDAVLEVKPEPTLEDCIKMLALSQNLHNRVCSLYINFIKTASEWQSGAKLIKDAWRAISMKSSDATRDGEFTLYFWELATELEKMEACLKVIQIAMDQAEKTCRTVSRQQAALESEARIVTSDRVFG